MKGRSVTIAKRKRSVHSRHSGPAVLKSVGENGEHKAPPTSTTAVVGTRELQLARALSDTEEAVRDAALEGLRAWLAEHAAELTAGDWDKLCKALFYCVWMADKRHFISFVVRRVVFLHESGGYAFLSALLRTIVREWHGVDRHRVDKYYELLNAIVSALVDLSAKEWTSGGVNRIEPVGRMIELVEEEVFNRAGSGGAGVALHVLDYWIENVLLRLFDSGEGSLSGNVAVVTFDIVMRPVHKLLGPTRGSLLGVSRRAVERVVERLPTALAEVRFGFSEKTQRDMLRRTMKRVWAAAASRDTLESCRKDLYAVYSTLKEHVAELEAAKDASAGLSSAECGEVEGEKKVKVRKRGGD